MFNVCFWENTVFDTTLFQADQAVFQIRLLQEALPFGFVEMPPLQEGQMARMAARAALQGLGELTE